MQTQVGQSGQQIPVCERCHRGSIRGYIYFACFLLLVCSVRNTFAKIQRSEFLRFEADEARFTRKPVMIIEIRVLSKTPVPWCRMMNTGHYNLFLSLSIPISCKLIIRLLLYLQSAPYIANLAVLGRASSRLNVNAPPGKETGKPNKAIC